VGLVMEEHEVVCGVMEALWGLRKQHNMGKAEDAHSWVLMPAGLVYTDQERGCKSWVGREAQCSSSGSCMTTVHIL
jgi:hypothetical protein